MALIYNLLDFRLYNFQRFGGFKPWSEGSRFEECSWNASFKGSKSWNFFTDWASHEEVKVCRSLQSLRANIQTKWANIESDHNESTIEWSLLGYNRKKLHHDHNYLIRGSWLQLKLCFTYKKHWGQIVHVLAAKSNVGWTMNDASAFFPWCTSVWMFSMQLPYFGTCFHNVKPLPQATSLPHRLFLQC